MRRVLVTALVAGWLAIPALAQDTKKEIQKYQEMLAEGSPVELFELEGEISQAVSRNPVFSFRLKGGAKGDKIEVSWLDNKGDTNRTETAVA